MTTEELLKSSLEAAVEEQPRNKVLHRAIGSVINRFYKSKDNKQFVVDCVKSESKQTTETKVAHIEWYPNQEKKTISGPTFKPKTVAGSGVDITVEDIQKKAQKIDDDGQGSISNNNDDSKNLENNFTGQDTGNEMLDMTTEQYLEVYGDLAGLKQFARETLNLDFANNATAEKVVALIKERIAKDAEAENQ